MHLFCAVQHNATRYYFAKFSETIGAFKCRKVGDSTDSAAPWCAAISGAVASPGCLSCLFSTSPSIDCQPKIIIWKKKNSKVCIIKLCILSLMLLFQCQALLPLYGQCPCVSAWQICISSPNKACPTPLIGHHEMNSHMIYLQLWKAHIQLLIMISPLSFWVTELNQKGGKKLFVLRNIEILT